MTASALLAAEGSGQLVAIVVRKVPGSLDMGYFGVQASPQFSLNSYIYSDYPA